MTQEQDGRELEPCPFCGGEAEIDRIGSPTQSTIYCCTICGCRLETGEEFNFGKQWNTRTPSPEAMREALAQIISPEVFNKEYELCHPDRARIEQFSAVKKADAVLAALRSSPQTEREGAAQQAQAET